LSSVSVVYMWRVWHSASSLTTAVRRGSEQVAVHELLTEGTTITLRHKGKEAGALRVGKVIVHRSSVSRLCASSIQPAQGAQEIREYHIPRFVCMCALFSVLGLAVSLLLACTQLYLVASIALHPHPFSHESDRLRRQHTHDSIRRARACSYGSNTASF